MTSATKVSSAVSTRYASALMDLAEDGKVIEKVESDLLELKKMIQESGDLSQAILSPSINRSQQQDAFFALADKCKFQTLTKNFLGVLIGNRRLPAILAIIEAFQDTLAKRRGEVTVNVQVAQDMTAEQKKELQAALSKSIGSDVSANITVEPSILGGMVVTIGSYMIDDSVHRKLERLKTVMSTQANENVQNISEVG